MAGRDPLTGLDRAHARVLRRFYDTDWASAGARKAMLPAFSDGLADGFIWTIGERLPPRTQTDKSMEIFWQAVEQDFSTYEREPAEITELSATSVRVTGVVVAKSRTSKETMARMFRDIWTFDDSGLVIELTLGRDVARITADVNQ